MKEKGWIGVDLDGTLAIYDGWKGELHIGDPIPLMVNRVKDWLEEGQRVKIFTARVCEPIEGSRERASVEEIRTAIQDWCEKHIGQRLEVTNIKDWAMIVLYDDRCIQVLPNSGMTLMESLQDG